VATLHIGTELLGRGLVGSCVTDEDRHLRLRW
jgi:hypothetical protein